MTREETPFWVHPCKYPAEYFDNPECYGRWNRGSKRCRKCSDRHECKKVTREK